MEYLFLTLIIVIICVFISCIKIVPQSYAYVIERLGGYKETWGVGLHIKMPFIDRIARKVLLKEQVVDFPPQSVITKDNVTMKIDTIVFFQITDAKYYTYGVDNPIMAIENLTATTLRNVIGELELDQTLTSRETINESMKVTLDLATDPWGIKVKRVELKNIIPPPAINEAMEKQMKAERERREAILRAEGEKTSTILVAEGKKSEAILSAEAEKEAAILKAGGGDAGLYKDSKFEANYKKCEDCGLPKGAYFYGNAKSTAEAKKEATIKEAEGQAQAILAVQQANAAGIRAIKEAGADEAVIRLKSLEAFEKAADGKATKIIIPSEIQNFAGGLKAVTEVVKDN